MSSHRTLCIVALAAFAPLVSAQEHAIGGKQSDVQNLSLAAGECADIVVDQKGIDVTVSVLDASGKVLTETDNEARIDGRERTIVVADSGATFQVSVKPRYSRAAAGAYVLTIVNKRPATDTDRALFEATKLATESATLQSAGKMEDSRAAAARALEAGEKALGPNDPFIGMLLLRNGHAERVLSHYAKAREAYERAAAIFEASFGRDDLRTADALDWTGMICVYEGDYRKAEALLKEALATFEHVLGREHPRVVLSLQHIAVAYQDLGDKQGAVATLERALQICEKAIDPADLQFTAIVNNLGTLYAELHDYPHAVPLLRRSLHMVEERLGPEHPFVAIPLQELAIIARETKQFDTAFDLLWRAEAAREKAFGLANPQTLALLIIIANTWDSMGDHARAVELHHRILDILENTVGPSNKLIPITLANLATGYTEVGDIACALEYETRMDDVIEKDLDLNLAIGSERQKLAYEESLSGGRTDRTISLHALHAPDNPEAAEHALLVLLQRKGRVLDALSQNLTTVRQALTADDQALLDKLRTTTAELAKLALNGPGKTPVASYRAQVKKLEDEKENLETAMGARSAAFRADHQPVTVAAVRNAIPRDAALVEFAVYRPFRPTAVSVADEFGEPRYIVYVLRRHGRIRWKDLGSAAAIDKPVAKWRAALRDPGRADVAQIAREVDRRVMQPVRELAGNATHLLIAPDGQLDLIPFEALVDARGRYLVERYTITYLTSGRDLLRMAVSRPGGARPVVVADPEFGEPAGARPVQVASAIAQRRSITTGKDFASVYFAPLAGTREEARKIEALFPDARVLVGNDATKAAVERVDAPEILHIATHGFFLESNDARGVRANPLLRSGLALRGANLTSGGSDDGILTASEASTLNLWGTKLVTLSACDSGVGEVKNREGVYGLRRAFLLAGAETVVMSLWPVSDYVTRQMMTAYYTALKGGEGRGEALRNAQLAMLRKSSLRQPFYWASFIQSGDWTPLGKR